MILNPVAAFQVGRLAWNNRRNIKKIYHTAGATVSDLMEPRLDQLILAAARDLEIQPAVPKAIFSIESRLIALGENGLPLIRMEPHWWRRLTERRTEKIRNPRSQDVRWETFELLLSIDEEAAIRSTSFGLPQMMGFNHRACGFKSPQLFLEDMKSGASAQVTAFKRFVRSNRRLHQAMKDHDLKAIAHHYNGPKYRRNQYDTKLANAIERYRHDFVV